MSLQARRDVWEVLAGADGRDRTWKTLAEIRLAHPSWYEGLVQLAQWGWLLEFDAGRRRIRVKPVFPSDTNVPESTKVLARVREAAAEDLRKVTDDDGSLGYGEEESDDLSDEVEVTSPDVSPDAEPLLEPEPVLESDDREEVGFGALEETELHEDDQAEPQDSGAPDPGEIREAAGEEGRGGGALAAVPDFLGAAGGPGFDVAGAEVEGVSVALVLAGGAGGRRRVYRLDLGTLILDQTFVTSTNAILAVKGVGKSYSAMVIAEAMIENDLPFSVLDPTGAWWGLRAPGGRGDTRHPGFPILVVGGDHGDVPIHAMDGAAVAEWLVSRYPARLVCDLSLMTPEQQQVFALGFARKLYHDNRRATHVFVDEADEFIPQRPQSASENSCLQAFDRLVRRGRIRGVGLTAITQRSAVLNKNVLSQVGALFVLRTAAPQDLKAIEGWLVRVLGTEEVKKFLSSLGSLKVGEGWHVAPGRRPIAARMSIRKRRTYDSSRTPEVGETVSYPDLCEVDPVLVHDFTTWVASNRAPAGDDDSDSAGEDGVE